MRTLPLSEAKAQLSKLIDELSSRKEEVTITRHGRPVAMLVRPDVFESWEATLEIMSDPEFLADIRAAIKDADEGRLISEEEMNAQFDRWEAEAAEHERSKAAPADDRPA